MRTRKCIIKSQNYGGSYYNGEGDYTKELSQVKIFDENNIPAHIHDSHRERIIYLDSKEGLIPIIEKIESFISQIKEESIPKLMSGKEKNLKKLLKSDPKMREMMNDLNGLYNFNPEIIGKYFKIHPFMREIRNKDSLIEELIEESQLQN
jgi:hypothetical protein